MLFQTFTKLTFGLSDVLAVTIQLVNCGSRLYLETYSLIRHLTLGLVTTRPQAHTRTSQPSSGDAYH